MGTEVPSWGGVVPRMRLDFALVNAAMEAALPTLNCTVHHSKATSVLSDHYPILCETLPL